MLLLDAAVGHTHTQTREQRAATMRLDLIKLGVKVEVVNLPSGDVSFTGYGPDGNVEVGIELKTVQGLLGDMVSGRFVGQQIPAMQEAFQYRYLVIEGAMRPSGSDGILEIPKAGVQWWPSNPRIMYVDFMKWLDDIRLRAGFHVWHTWGRLETVFFIAAEYHGWRKPWDRHKGLQHFHEARGGVVLLRPPTLLRLWARDLPGVGWARSEAVERKFDTPLAMTHASEREWGSIPGIGKVIAARVWRAIRGLK